MASELIVVQPKEKKISLPANKESVGQTIAILDPSLHEKASQIEKLDSRHTYVLSAYLILGVFLFPFCMALILHHDYAVLKHIIGGIGAALAVICPSIPLLAGYYMAGTRLTDWRNKRLETAGLPALLEAEKQFEETNPVCLAKRREELIASQRVLQGMLDNHQEELAQIDVKLGLPPFRKDGR